jgi:choice-of-anchor B domain-containing protein
MRTRMFAVLAAFALVSALAMPAVAHHDDGGFKYEGLDPKQDRDWELSEAGRRGSGGNAPSTFAPCVDGMAAGFFPCDGVDMLSHVSHAELGTTFVNDIWGWTDQQTKRDYALVGASEGTVFVDITDAKRPQVLGILPTASTSGGAFWRDIKVYADHAFVVSEHNDHGVQVFDLTRLRDWDGVYTTYDMDAHYTGHGRAHNIAINEATGFAYSLGSRQTPEDIECGTGLHMIDIRDPLAPTFAGCFDDLGYVHDTQCVIYEGPDVRYQGQELCFNSTAAGGRHEVTIVDVTDKSAPKLISSSDYPQFGYSHQGWLTPDQTHFLHGDELDELRHGIGTTTRVWNVTDLENPQLVQVFENVTSSIDHNIYTQGRYAYASNYTSGLRVYDIRDVATGGMREVGYFDVYPENDNASFEGGTWSNYPYFRQKGVVAVSSIDRGLFILQPRVGRAGN